MEESDEAAGDMSLSAAEVAQYLGVSRGSVYAWVRTSRLPLHRQSSGGVMRFRLDEIDAWLETCRARHG